MRYVINTCKQGYLSFRQERNTCKQGYNSVGGPLIPSYGFQTRFAKSSEIITVITLLLIILNQYCYNHS